MKREVGTVDATPSKRVFLSVIADYDLNRSVCELVDNALDVWARDGRRDEISISVTLDVEQQTITVADDAGGLARDELSYIVGPGQTSTSPTDQTIGIFGVGTKRAVVALAQDIRISTRRPGSPAYRIDIDDEWLADDDWHLPVYEVDNLDEGTTVVELQRGRRVRPGAGGLAAKLRQPLAPSNGSPLRANGERRQLAESRPCTDLLPA